MELTKAREIAEDLKHRLEPGCDRVKVAGSIRRQKSDPKDIELLAIPKYDGLVDMLDREIQTLMLEGILDCRLSKRGHRVYGPKNKLMLHIPTGIGVDIFSTDEVCWPVALVVRTGGKKTNKRIATTAIRRDYRFHAYGSGFSTPQGYIVCHSEREVFEVVDLPYLEPWERD
jgi:DNA polymerase/3'-5' exonuclease PolX